MRHGAWQTEPLGTKKSIGVTAMANSKGVAIVTGAARPWGLGRCTATGLAAKGFDIVVVDMRDDWGEEAAAAIRKETETKAAYLKTDLRQRSDIEAMVARVIREFGRIDVLANVAAICPSERIEDMKEETYEQVFRTNFLGTAFCCQAVLKQGVPGFPANRYVRKDRTRKRSASRSCSKCTEHEKSLDSQSWCGRHPFLRCLSTSIYPVPLRTRRRYKRPGPPAIRCPILRTVVPRRVIDRPARYRFVLPSA